MRSLHLAAPQSRSPSRSRGSSISRTSLANGHPPSASPICSFNSPFVCCIFAAITISIYIGCLYYSNPIFCFSSITACYICTPDIMYLVAFQSGEEHSLNWVPFSLEVDIAYAPLIERFKSFFLDVKNYDITKGRPKLTKWIKELNKIDAYTATVWDPQEWLGLIKKRFGIE